MVFGCVVVSLALFGASCRKPEAPAVETPPPAEAPPLVRDTDANAYEQYRSGVVQLGVATSSLSEAREATNRLLQTASGEAREGVREALDALDSAGDRLSEVEQDVPSEERFRADFAYYDDRRLSLIEKANDSLEEARQAAGNLRSLGYDDAADLADVAADDVSKAVEGLGGTPDEPSA